MIAPESLREDGHPARHPSLPVFATDSKIIKGNRYIYVDLRSREIETVSSFLNPPDIDREIRCDPHPRWNRDGTMLCYDGLINGSSQLLGIKIEKTNRNEMEKIV